jgi:hypothetical protein
VVDVHPHPEVDAWRRARAALESYAAAAADLGRLVDVDHDPAETSYFEAYWDADAQYLDDQERRRCAQYVRHLRRLRHRRRDA